MKDMTSRILTRQEMARVADELRAAGKKIVTTNGCFDILHVGHVRVLQAARELGDVLIVGVNSDESVRKLKGPNRPVNTQQDRAEVLANLKSVDYVTIFGEETASELLQSIKPDVYAKGADYTTCSLPETPTVQSYGGEIAFLELVPGKSTTAIVAKIQQP
jgi:rfaE bifunctional protein nucleotidyltransferase chain/domain